MPDLLAPIPPRLPRVVLQSRERDPALAEGRRLLESAARRSRVLGLYKARRETPESARLKVLGRLRVDAQKATRDLTGRLLRGELSRAAWQRRMRAVLVPAHYAAAMAGTGGIGLDPRALADVQGQIRTQLGYLDRFRRDVATGKIDGRVLARSDLYGAAVWSTGQAARAGQARRQGHTEEMAILSARDSCESCVNRASLGWQPIGTLLPIGAGLCRSRCGCHITYRGGDGAVTQVPGRKRPTLAALQADPESQQVVPAARSEPVPGRFRSGSDVVEWGKTAYPKIKFDVDELPPAALNEIIGHFDRLAKKFPEVTERLEYVGTFKSKDAPVKVDWSGPTGKAIALGDVKSGRVLGFNPARLSDLDAIKEQFKGSEERGYFAPGAGAGGAKYAVSHEFGHLLDASLKKNNPAAYARLRGLIAAGNPGDISLYAKTNANETVAEAFASLVHSPREQKSELAKSIGLTISDARKGAMADRTPKEGRIALAALPSEARLAVAKGRAMGSKDLDIATASERVIVEAIGGKHTGDSKPVDVEIRRKSGRVDGLEIKTVLRKSTPSLSVDADALLRKVEYVQADPNRVVHTIVNDQRDAFEGGKYSKLYSGSTLRYQRGAGPKNISKMHPVGSFSELRRLIEAPDRELPEAARGGLPDTPREIAKLREAAAVADAGRKRRDAARRERRKAEKAAARGS